MSEQTPVTQASDTTVKAPLEKKYGFLTSWQWQWLWLTVSTCFVAWVPFFGYTYLMAKLERCGFENININSKMYDLVALFLEGWTTPLVKIAKVPSSTMPEASVFTKVVLIAGFIVFSVLMYFSLKLKYAKTRDVQAKSAVSFKEFFQKLYENAAYSVKDAAILLLGSMFAASVAMTVQCLVPILVLFSGAFLWLLSVLGIVAGQNDADLIMAQDICITMTVEEMNDRLEQEHKQYGWGCAQIDIDGEPKYGKRLYSDHAATFFLTNEGAYQIDANGKMVYFKALYRNHSPAEGAQDSTS